MKTTKTIIKFTVTAVAAIVILSSCGRHIRICAAYSDAQHHNFYASR